jgi:glycerophosphoryl diester phosphodiesterase
MLAFSRAEAAQPLANAHAHNDYRHTRPLDDALDQGFTSVEADIFLVDGQLLVAHDLGETSADRTLKSLYLVPLLRRVQQNGGKVYPNGRRFIRLIDIKCDAADTYEHLHRMLSEFASVLTTAQGHEISGRAITVIISGNRPFEALQKSEIRFAGLDGRLSDLDSDMSASLLPMISDKRPSHFRWDGRGPFPAEERAKLNDIVQNAHRKGRVVRFWATPENPKVWRELRAAGVDLIGTDQLEQLATFLRASEPRPCRRPSVDGSDWRRDSR